MSSEKDLFSPIIFYSQGVCPKCNSALVVLSNYEISHIFLNDHGLPYDNISKVLEIVQCPFCGYTGFLGKDYIKLEDGSYKWVTEMEKAYQEERIANLKPITHLHADKNPFMKNEEK